MIEEYLTVANRIRQELDDLARVVRRAERAIMASRRQSEEQDLYLDSAALNLHDFYSGDEYFSRFLLFDPRLATHNI